VVAGGRSRSGSPEPAAAAAAPLPCSAPHSHVRFEPDYNVSTFNSRMSVILNKRSRVGLLEIMTMKNVQKNILSR